MIAIDTNILVYAFDSAYPTKREICKNLINEIFNGKKEGVVTNQILAEFCAVVTKKMEKPLSKEQACSIVGAILASQNWKVLTYTGETVMHAVTGTKSSSESL